MLKTHVTVLLVSLIIAVVCQSRTIIVINDSAAISVQKLSRSSWTPTETNVGSQVFALVLTAFFNEEYPEVNIDVRCTKGNKELIDRHVSRRNVTRTMAAFDVRTSAAELKACFGYTTTKDGKSESIPVKFNVITTSAQKGDTWGNKNIYNLPLSLDLVVPVNHIQEQGSVIAESRKTMEVVDRLWLTNHGVVQCKIRTCIDSAFDNGYRSVTLSPKSSSQTISNRKGKSMLSQGSACEIAELPYRCCQTFALVLSDLSYEKKSGSLCTTSSQNLAFTTESESSDHNSQIITASLKMDLCQPLDTSVKSVTNEDIVNVRLFRDKERTKVASQFSIGDIVYGEADLDRKVNSYKDCTGYKLRFLGAKICAANNQCESMLATDAVIDKWQFGADANLTETKECSSMILFKFRASQKVTGLAGADNFVFEFSFMHSSRNRGHTRNNIGNFAINKVAASTRLIIGPCHQGDHLTSSIPLEVRVSAFLIAASVLVGVIMLLIALPHLIYKAMHIAN